MRKFVFSLVFCFLSSAFAEEAAPLRDFNPDRPGSTNTPFTINPGHFQLEMELFNYSSFVDRRSAPETTETQLNYPTPNLRVGVTASSEVQISWLTQQVQNVHVAGQADEKTSGFGDVNLNYKYNLVGNDGGVFGLALMPGLKIPTNTKGTGNNKWEPHLMIPVSFALGDWGLSFMPEIDLLKDAETEQSHGEYNFPVNLGHSLFGNFGGYVEVVGHSSAEKDSTPTEYFGTGITYKVGSDMQFDLGCNLGLNDSTPQTDVFAGWVIRY